MKRLTVLAALLQGCAATAGPQASSLPPAQTATVYAARIKSDLGFKERSIQISEIDGRIVGNYFRGYPAKIDLAPGDHKIKFRYYDSDAGGAGTVREMPLKAKAGARYIITFDPSEVRQTAIWLEDRATGEIVGGARPSRDKAAVEPISEAEIPRTAWMKIAPDTAVQLYAKSGLILTGRVISSDGEYLWLQLSEGGKKALLRSEIDKIVAVK